VDAGEAAPFAGVLVNEWTWARIIDGLGRTAEDAEKRRDGEMK